MDQSLNHSPNPPHVLIFPLPAQGHVNSMLKLAELLSISGFYITFLNTERIHENLIRFTDVEARFMKYSGFKFMTISDGLDGSRITDPMVFFDSMDTKVKPIFKQMLIDIKTRVNCIIGDGFLRFILDTASEVGIPVIHFRTVSAACFWACFSSLDLIQAGELPIKGEEDMDRTVTKVPGMENLLRCRDLPSYCRAKDVNDRLLQMVIEVSRQSVKAHGLIFNTFEDLEEKTLAQIRNQCPKIYTIGPLHEHLKVKLQNINAEKSHNQSSNSLLEEDRSCIAWLDNQAPKSVIYVSFGSFTPMTKKQVMEFWQGIVNSKTRFLWVIRADSVQNKDHEVEEIPEELKEGQKENGYIVKWAPQEEVLAHKSVGGFLTHNGWNSTLESIVAGVPMICWPYFADQQVNSRFVSEIWKLGLDMKDLCDRKIVEKMVNDLMVNRREEFVKSSARMAELARKSVNEGGSSSCNLYCLIEDIKMMSLQARVDELQVNA